MTDKALISDLTWRSLEMQKAAFPGMPYFMVPDDLAQVFRPTTRTTADHIHVKSLGVIADNEKAFRDFLALLKARKACLHSQDECLAIAGHTVSADKLVEIWKHARRNGAAKIGANISADRKKAATKEAIEKIKDRWPMSSDEWPTKVLLAEADISLNTAKAHLGKRPIAQYNYQAKLKRKANAKR